MGSMLVKSSQELQIQGFFSAAVFIMSSRWQCDPMENAGSAFSEFPSLVKKVLWVKDGWEKVLLKFSSPKISLS